MMLRLILRGGDKAEVNSRKEYQAEVEVESGNVGEVEVERWNEDGVQSKNWNEAKFECDSRIKEVEPECDN